MRIKKGSLAENYYYSNEQSVKKQKKQGTSKKKQGTSPKGTLLKGTFPKGTPLNESCYSWAFPAFYQAN